MSELSPSVEDGEVSGLTDPQDLEEHPSAHQLLQPRTQAVSERATGTDPLRDLQ